MTNICYDLELPSKVVGMKVRDIHYTPGERRSHGGVSEIARFYTVENIEIQERTTVPMWPTGAKAELLLKTTGLRKVV